MTPYTLESFSHSSYFLSHLNIIGVGVSLNVQKVFLPSVFRAAPSDCDVDDDYDDIDGEDLGDVDGGSDGWKHLNVGRSVSFQGW